VHPEADHQDLFETAAIQALETQRLEKAPDIALSL